VRCIDRQGAAADGRVPPLPEPAPHERPHAPNDVPSQQARRAAMRVLSASVAELESLSTDALEARASSFTAFCQCLMDRGHSRPGRGPASQRDAERRGDDPQLGSNGVGARTDGAVPASHSSASGCRLAAASALARASWAHTVRGPFASASTSAPPVATARPDHPHRAPTTQARILATPPTSTKPA
jgi:hypothetical protein